MTINNAINFFESLKNLTERKSELKIYKQFIEILSNLKNRDFNEVELKSIESNLTELKLTEIPGNKSRYFRKKLRVLKEYLNKKFSLITKGYYAYMGLGLGMTFGLAIGTSIFGVDSGVTTGMMFGMFIGFIIGRYKDSEAEKENRVLSTNLK